MFTFSVPCLCTQYDVHESSSRFTVHCITSNKTTKNHWLLALSRRQNFAFYLKVNTKTIIPMAHSPLFRSHRYGHINRSNVHTVNRKVRARLWSRWIPYAFFCTSSSCLFLFSNCAPFQLLSPPSLSRFIIVCVSGWEQRAICIRPMHSRVMRIASDKHENTNYQSTSWWWCTCVH